MERPIDLQPIEDEGDIARKWEPVRNDWAAFRHLGGSEFFAAQQLQIKVTHAVTMRYTSNRDLTPDHRLVRISDGHVFQISFVAGSPEGDSLELLVVEGRP